MSLSPTQFSYLAKRSRNALAAGSLTHEAYAILEALLWDIRKHGTDVARASYSWLMERGHCCRQTVSNVDQGPGQPRLHR
jgi:hypothetical protein